MKKLIFPYIWLITGLALFSCKKSLDLKPLNEISDADYWKNADQFKLAANEFYTFMASFNTVLADGSEGANPGPAPHSDLRSDLITSGSRNVFSNGSNTIPLTDKRWDTAYSRIRTTNYLLAQAAKYSSPAEISKYVAEAKFFRAYVYFDLLQLYGGVPLIDKLLNVNSPELQAPRNTRDEIVDFIITDLNAAIPDLPIEAVITAADKGRVSKGAAQAFLSRVALYEGTWQKFRGNAARANALLDTAIFRSNEVINSNQYTLFGTSGASAGLGDSALKYMFILENQKSNPLSITKLENKEYILANRYDYSLRQIRMNITHAAFANIYWITRKFANMYLCQDGLPVDKSPMFQGYATTTSEFTNRDNRMRYTMVRDGYYHWDNEIGLGCRITWNGDATDLAHSRGKHNSAFSSGYHNQKWASERGLSDNEEAYDYPVIRYAEVLLNYAEAVFERFETISDADLDKSLNLVRNRVNKTMPKLSNALVAGNGLDMRTEIRRERTLEFFLEGFRVDDLKRWKTAETEMPMPLQGIKWKGTAYETRWPSLSTAKMDADGVYIIEDAGARKWEQKNYLLPIPSQQRLLNPNLDQNEGW